ncbi:MAG: MFS transporter [Promethearchaeota archaeon]|nr:MAG: MFS transporter [Candidatus Lokiarchaeota archaeon]
MLKPNYKDKEEHAKYLAQYDIDPRKAMLTIILSILVDVFGYSMVLPLLPTIAKNFGASDFIVGILISSNALSALIFGPIWGRLSDRFGRKPILIISQAGTGISFLILAFSPDLSFIFFSRVLDGIFGGQIPVIRAYIADITTPKTRSAKMTTIMVGNTAGMIFGPIIGGFLGTLNWRYPAFLASGLSVLTIILTKKLLIESLPKERISDLRLHFDEIEKSAGNLKRTIWKKEVILRLIQIFLTFMITVMINSSFPLILDKRFGANPFIIGTVMTAAGIVLMLYAGLAMKFLLKKIGEKRLLILGILLLIVNFIIFPMLNELWMVYIFVIPFALSMATIPPLLQSNLTKAVDPDKQGIVSGWSTNFQSISQTMAPLVSTYYLDINGVILFSLYLNSYQLIGFTAVFLGIILSLIVAFDFKKNPHLYD